MDLEKRKFLRVLFLGGGILLAGRVLGPVFRVAKNKQIQGFFAEGDSFDDLKKVEKKKEVVFYNKKKEKVLIVEKS